MSLFTKKKDENSDVHYEGNAILRMLSYAKPYVPQILFCFLMVIVVTAMELYKPIIIGDAIDLYITGDFLPGEMVDM